MKTTTLGTTLAALSLPLLALTTAPANATEAPAGGKSATAQPSIKILTRSATAVGWPLPHSPYDVHRPTYTLTALVRCPAGETARLEVPVGAHTNPYVYFTCTGTPQRVSHHAAVSTTRLGTTTVPVTAKLHTSQGQISDTRWIRIRTTVTDNG